MERNSDLENDETEDLQNFHQIQNRYTFWYRGGTGGAKAQPVNYTESIKKISSFQSVEHFWRIYDYLKRPNDFRFTTEYHLFKEGITPTWEDPQNKLGGKWMIRLKKGISSRYWEDVILGIIGEQFDVGPEICGAVLSVRNNEDIISVWNKTADNLEAVNKIRDQLRRALRLPSIIAIEYKRHQDSLVDNSSYRNPTMVWRASTARHNNNPDQQQHQGNSMGVNNGKGHHVGFNNTGGFSNRSQQDGGKVNTDASHYQSGNGGFAKPSAWKTTRPINDSSNSIQSEGGQPSSATTYTRREYTSSASSGSGSSSNAWGRPSTNSNNSSSGNNSEHHHHRNSSENRESASNTVTDKEDGAVASAGGWQRGIGVPARVAAAVSNSANVAGSLTIATDTSVNNSGATSGKGRSSAITSPATNGPGGSTNAWSKQRSAVKAEGVK